MGGAEILLWLNRGALEMAKVRVSLRGTRFHFWLHVWDDRA